MTIFVQNTTFNVAIDSFTSLDEGSTKSPDTALTIKCEETKKRSFEYFDAQFSAFHVSRANGKRILVPTEIQISARTFDDSLLAASETIEAEPKYKYEEIGNQAELLAKQGFYLQALEKFYEVFTLFQSSGSEDILTYFKYHTQRSYCQLLTGEYKEAYDSSMRRIQYMSEQTEETLQKKYQFSTEDYTIFQGYKIEIYYIACISLEAHITATDEQDYAELNQLIEKFEDEYPMHRIIFFMKARLAICGRLINQDPDTVSGQLATSFFQQNLGLSSHLNELPPHFYAQCHIILGLLAQKHNKEKKAEKHFTTAIGYFEEYKQEHFFLQIQKQYFLAYCYFMLGHKEKAKMLLDTIRGKEHIFALPELAWIKAPCFASGNV